VSKYTLNGKNALGDERGKFDLAALVLSKREREREREREKKTKRDEEEIY
jgi:hypothetical protein